MTRTRNSAKQAGSSFERLIADGLAWLLKDDRIDRRPKTGAKDKGDIGGVRTAAGERVTIEAKNAARIDLAGWLREAHVEAQNDNSPIGVVVFKRRGKGKPEDQYVLMDVATFARIIRGGAS